MVGIRLQSCKHLQTFRGFWCVLCGWTGRNTQGTGKSKRNSIDTTPGSYHSLNIGKCVNIPCCVGFWAVLSCLIVSKCQICPMGSFRQETDPLGKFWNKTDPLSLIGVLIELYPVYVDFAGWKCIHGLLTWADFLSLAPLFISAGLSLREWVIYHLWNFDWF